MNSISASPGYFSSCSSESDNDSSSDSEENFPYNKTIDSNEENLKIGSQRRAKSQNFLSKLLNREVSRNDVIFELIGLQQQPVVEMT